MKQGQTLTALAAEIERQETAKVDYIADTRQMHFVTVSADPGWRSEIDLVADEGWVVDAASGLQVSKLAHEQIASHLNIPKRYYDYLRAEVPGLLDENVNRLLRHEPERRMLRTLDGTARAFLSDRYRRLDNGELARAIIPILGEIPEVQIASCALTDTRMYIKAVTPRVAGEVKVGEEVCAGVIVQNSEVGLGSLRVQPLVYTLACSNGMIVGKDLGGVALSRIHVGRRLAADEATYRVFRDETLQADDRAFFMAAADVVRAAVDEVRFRELLGAMQAAASSQPVKDVVGAVQVLAKNEGLHDGEQRDVLAYLAAGGDLTRWGVLSAVTRAAEDQPDYDRATELEAVGGKILSYSTAEWRALTEAAA